ncbi:MAG: paeninodin family lasso peptide [Pseudomonadota bacterium]
MTKIEWTKPELEALDVEETLTGPVNTPVETIEAATGDPFGSPNS